MKAIQHTALPFLLLALSSCTSLPQSGTDLSEMRTSLQEGLPFFTDQDIEALANLQPQVEVPFRLGIAPPLELDASHSRWYKPEPSVGTWSAEEKAHLEAWTEEMQRAGILSEVVFLPGLLVDHRNEDEAQSLLHSARSAAARSGVDVVLVVRVVSRASSRANALSLFYLTLVGSFFVPGNDVHCRSLVEGVLVDVSNEYLYSIMEAQAEDESSTAPVYEAGRVEERLEQTRMEAIEEMTEGFGARAVELGLLLEG